MGSVQRYVILYKNRLWKIIILEEVVDRITVEVQEIGYTLHCGIPRRYVYVLYEDTYEVLHIEDELGTFKIEDRDEISKFLDEVYRLLQIGQIIGD